MKDKILLIDIDGTVSEDIKKSLEAQEIISSTSNDFINEIIELVFTLDSLEQSDIQTTFKEFANIKGIKIGELMKPIRSILTGNTSSPSVFEIISILGKKHTINRLKKH